MTKIADKYREMIIEKLRTIRREKGWTQKGLARVLGISQGSLSLIEHGKGSLTAEQFLSLADTFHIPWSEWVPSPPVRREDQLWETFRRKGAEHLSLPESLSIPEETDLAKAVSDVLVLYPNPRLVAGIAPVFLKNGNPTLYRRLAADLEEKGFLPRAGWVFENCAAAYRKLLAPLPKDLTERQVRRALFTIEQGIDFVDSRRGEKPFVEDIFDGTILSRETFEDVKKTRSTISSKWGIVTRLQPLDFEEALSDVFEPAS